MLAEVLTNLQWLEFLKQQDESQFDELFADILSLQHTCKNRDDIQACIQSDLCK